MKFGRGTQIALVAHIFIIAASVDDARAAAAAASTITNNRMPARRSVVKRKISHSSTLPNGSSTSISHVLLAVRGGEASTSSERTSDIDNDARILSPELKAHTLNTLHQTTFLIVVSSAMVMFTPLPSLTRHLAESTTSSTPSSYSPQAKAIQILSILSAISASIELFLSPLVGILIDKFGRKHPSVLLHALISCANLGVVLLPSVGSVCLSRMVNVIMGGFLMIVSNTMIADVFSRENSDKKSDGAHSKDQLGSVMGRQAAIISLGFLLGSVAGGRITEYGERAAYGAALVFSLLAMVNMAFRMKIDSLQFSKDAAVVSSTTTEDANKYSWDGATLREKLLEAPLSSIQLLFHYGSHMRTLAVLMMLQQAPGCMGDVFQMFAREEWGLGPKDFAPIIALFGVIGIISNISLPPILQAFGLRNFTLFAIISSILGPIATIFSNTYKPFLVAATLGLYGGAQRVGTSAAMTSLATELGIPQGKLQGEKASMFALLKIGMPVVYSMLYLKGKEWSAVGSSLESGDGIATVGLEMMTSRIGRKLPFVLNVMLGFCAFAVTWKEL